MTNSESRYRQVSRRKLLQRSFGLGALALVPGLACSDGDDATVFAGASAPASATTEPTGPAATATETAANPADTPEADAATDAAASAATVAPDEAATATPEPTAAPPVATTALPSGATMVIDFSYVQAAGGKNLPPYVAVWLEDSIGNLVNTIELWYQQDRKGPKWLPDLKRWFSVDQTRINAGGPDLVDVISAPTRLAGSYTIAWDGLLDTGPAAPGDYFICIEAARERGPYSLIREPIALAGVPFEQPLASVGELEAANVAVRA